MQITENPQTLTLDELLTWLKKLSRSQEFNTPTNIVDITVDQSDARKIILHTK